MDEETEAALELSRDDLLAMRDSGTPGRVGKRPRDVNSLAAAIVAEATEPTDEISWEVSLLPDAPPVAMHGLGWSTSSDPYVTLDDTPSLTFA